MSQARRSCCRAVTGQEFAGVANESATENGSGLPGDTNSAYFRRNPRSSGDCRLMRESAISRIALHDASAWNARYQCWKYVVPLPPESLMWSVGGHDVENFLVVADAWAQVVSRFTTPGCSVLDMGSGCGRTARVLLNNRWISVYIGFDVVAESVAWCNNFIKPAWLGARCEFHHADIYSREYNPNGALKGVEFAFPCANASMDIVFAASLFTHLLEQDARHYLCEVRRVLQPRGTAILSIHDQ